MNSELMTFYKWYGYSTATSAIHVRELVVRRRREQLDLPAEAIDGGKRSRF
jgi:hypothetical protein